VTLKAALSAILIAALGGCAAPGGPYPSLQPRAAERIDPRVAVERPVNDRPASSELVARLAALQEHARDGDAAFQPLADTASRQAEAAGPRQSESWIAAQQALSAAVAARAPVASALADADALGADKLQAQRGLSPNDLKAIQDAAAAIGAIDAREAAAVDAIQRRLGG
jgi:hypothetical protein